MNRYRQALYFFIENKIDITPKQLQEFYNLLDDYNRFLLEEKILDNKINSLKNIYG